MVDTKEKTYDISLTENEIRQEIADIERSEDFQLFLRVSNGARLNEKLQKLSAILPKKE